MAQMTAIEETRQIREYNIDVADAWKFKEDELSWLEHNAIHLLREVWGYWVEKNDDETTNYEAITHRGLEGYRALQEYTDVLFRVLAHIHDRGYTRVFPSDAVPKILSQSEYSLTHRASEAAKHNMSELVAHYLQEPQVREKMELLANQNMDNSSAGFACFIYTARQLLRMGATVATFPTVDGFANLWSQRLDDLKL